MTLATYLLAKLPLLGIWSYQCWRSGDWTNDSSDLSIGTSCRNGGFDNLATYIGCWKGSFVNQTTSINSQNGSFDIWTTSPNSFNGLFKEKYFTNLAIFYMQKKHLKMRKYFISKQTKY